jgi:uncharacterized protein (DUF1778 family)
MSPGANRNVTFRIHDGDFIDLIDRAASAAGRSRAAFIIEASRRAAEEYLLDQRDFSLNERQSDALARIFDDPPAPNALLRKTMSTPAPWDAK